MTAPSVTNRIYETPPVDPQWLAGRNVDLPVAIAIHAIGAADRSPEAICAAPTPIEQRLVRGAIREYLREGDYPWPGHGSFQWGDQPLALGDQRGISRRAEAYWNEHEDRYVIMPYGRWIQVLYEHGTGPQVTSVVCFTHETPARAGALWEREVAALWGHPVTVLAAAFDEGEIEHQRIKALLAKR